MNQNILFAITPKWYYTAFLVAVIFLIFGGPFTSIAYIIINTLLALLGVKAGLFIHECGHLLMAKWVGGIPKRLVLGRGHEILRMPFLGVKLIVHEKINLGLAFADFRNPESLRTRLFAYAAGGILFNIGVATLAYLVWGDDPNWLGLREGIKPSMAITVPNALLGLTALLPYHINYNGLRLPTDGLHLMRIPFYKQEYLLKITQENDLLIAYDHVMEKEFEQAKIIYENSVAKNPESKVTWINLSLCYLKLGQFGEALALLKQAEAVVEEKEIAPFSMFIWNNLAWSYLLKAELELADEYARKAFLQSPEEPNVRGTRAVIHIELGRLEEGKGLMLKNVNFDFANSQTLMAALYLAYAFYQEGNAEETSNYLNFVKGHIDKLDIDEKWLYDRTVQKMTP